MIIKFKYWIKALRLHQWSKNTLLFLALFMSHEFSGIISIIELLIAFLSFSLCASAVYIFNDLSDLEADRKHFTKKNRPFASGKLSVDSGKLAIPVLLIISFLLSLNFLPGIFSAILLIYIVSTTSYSLYLKEKIFIDVIVLGALYTLRVLAGGLAVGVEVSTWLLGFSWFFFLSLAFMKRYTDLLLIKNNADDVLPGRGYSVIDSDIVQKAGITSGFISLLILVLYINSEQVVLLYKAPALIWLAIPILLYWLMRMWLIAHRGNMADDPVIFAVKDKTSYIIIFLILFILVMAANLDLNIFI